MAELKELIEGRDTKRSEIDEILNSAEKEERQLTEEEVEKVDSLKNELRGLNKTIEEAYENERNTNKNLISDLEQKVKDLEAERTKMLEDGEKVDEVQRSLDEATEKIKNLEEEGRGLSELTTKIESLETEKRELELKIEKFTERRMEFNLSRAIVEAARNGGQISNEVRERNGELLGEARGFVSNDILFTAEDLRDHNTTNEDDNIPQNPYERLSIIGKKPLWMEMGVNYLPNLSGNITLPYKSPEVAQLLAEKANETADVLTKTGVLLAPARFQKSQLYTKELLASENPVLHNKQVADLLAGVDRKITSEVYAKALAAASTVAAANDISKDSLDLLQAGAVVEMNGAFASDRATFFAAKSVPIDTGSGIFLVTLGETMGIGKTYEGVPYFYSELFEDGTDQQYVVYGDFYEIVVGDWGMFEIIVDPYTAKKTGQVEITVSRIAAVACQNPAAFAKTADLDAA